MTTTTDTSIKPGWRVPDCPPSAVVDMITCWTSAAGELLVFPGDLILWGSDFRLVLTIEPHGSGDGVMVLLDGMPWPALRGALADGRVAVRRYVEG